MSFNMPFRKKRTTSSFSINDYKKWQEEHPNFMTPNVLSTEKKGDYVIEVSKGRGFQNDTIYGVSILKSVGNGKFQSTDHEYEGKSKMFYSEEEAKDYAKKVKMGVKA